MSRSIDETLNENDKVYSMYLMEKRVCYTSTSIVDCKDHDDNGNVTKEEGGSIKSLHVNHDYHLEKSYLDGKNDDDMNDDGIKNQSEKQSTLVIHVGPNRSGTKYFQKMLANDEARNILLKDKYIFIGMCEEEARFDDCFYRNKAKSPFSSEDETELTPELQASFSRMQTEHINGLLIWDGAMPWIGKLKPFIKEFEVRIVATYRRLFDFLPSLYSKNMEKYKFPDGDAIGPLPFDFFTEDRLNELAAIKYARNFKWLAYHDGKHTTKDRLDTAASFNVDSLAIMDFHAKYEHENGNDLSIELFCTGAIPGTNHTCEAAKKNIIKGDMGNKDKKLQVDYFTFAYYAFKKGMLKARPHRAMVERIQNIMQNFNSTRFKKICMTESNLKKLYALSWKHEKIIYPERSEEGHKKAFEELKENGKFCSLDVLDVFRDERMRAWVSNWNMM